MSTVEKNIFYLNFSETGCGLLVKFTQSMKGHHMLLPYINISIL